MMYDPDLVWKNKETGETVLISKEYHRYVNHKMIEEVYLLDKHGVSLGKIDENVFYDKYEKVIPDFSGLIPNLLEFALNDFSLKQGLLKLARRLHPGGYFHVGDYVFIIKEYLNEHLFESGENRERPFKIISIDNMGPLSQLITIAPSRSWYKSGVEEEGDENSFKESGKIRIPLYLDKFESNDAFTCLRRYDISY